MMQPIFQRLNKKNQKRYLYYKARLFEKVGIRRFSFPALNNIDRVLAKVIGRRDGFFVEAGANDGFTQSNTYALERFLGWTGLLIEPVPWLADLCREFRPRSSVKCCALGPTKANGTTLEVIASDLMSTVANN